MSPFYLQEVGNLARYHGRLTHLTAFVSCCSRIVSDCKLTPSRYLSWPKRSKYLLQKGKVPKFLLITLRSLPADAIRNGTLGASATLA